MNTEFIEALEQENLNAIRRLPKADLHNHFCALREQELFERKHRKGYSAD